MTVGIQQLASGIKLVEDELCAPSPRLRDSVPAILEAPARMRRIARKSARNSWQKVVEWRRADLSTFARRSPWQRRMKRTLPPSCGDIGGGRADTGGAGRARRHQPRPGEPARAWHHPRAAEGDRRAAHHGAGAGARRRGDPLPRRRAAPAPSPSTPRPPLLPRHLLPLPHGHPRARRTHCLPTHRAPSLRAIVSPGASPHAPAWPRARGGGRRPLLAQERVRLLTLTGPAGVGKTRLALQVAATLRDQHGFELALVDLVAISSRRSGSAGHRPGTGRAPDG